MNLIVIYVSISLLRFAFIFLDSQCQHLMNLSAPHLDVIHNNYLLLILNILLELYELFVEVIELNILVVAVVDTSLRITISDHYLILYIFQFPSVSY